MLKEETCSGTKWYTSKNNHLQIKPLAKPDIIHNFN